MNAIMKVREHSGDHNESREYKEIQLDIDLVETERGHKIYHFQSVRPKRAYTIDEITFDGITFFQARVIAAGSRFILSIKIFEPRHELHVIVDDSNCCGSEQERI